MADQPGGEAGAPQGAAAGGAPQQQFGIRAQYVKDLSFENPNAAEALARREAPKIELQVAVKSRGLGEDVYEVELEIGARATQGENVAFLAELTYAGAFQVRGFAPEQLRPVLLIECPRLLFPFARRVLADATRDGGFPPLMVDPIDFVALYRRTEEARQAEATAKPAGGNGAADAAN